MTGERAIRRIALVGLQHESNSFVSGSTTRTDFEVYPPVGSILRGKSMYTLAGQSWCLSAVIDQCLSECIEMVPLLFAEAEPGPPLDPTDFDHLVIDICTSLRHAGPVDAVIAELHGAMLISDGRDGDAFILRSLRDVAGPDVPIIATVDMHANLTREMISCADAIIGYRTYPHVDLRETGLRALAAAKRCRGTAASNEKAFHFLPFIVPVNQECTLSEPGVLFYDALAKVEADYPELLALTLTMGFQPADIEYPVPAVAAFGTSAEAAADALLQHCLLLESRTSFTFHSIEEAVTFALQRRTRPLIMADAQDNPGGGSSGDCMALPKALLAAGIKATVAVVPDRDAVAKAHASGTGTTLRMSVGGKGISGDTPIEGLFDVVSVSHEAVRIEGLMMAEGIVDIGRSAHVRIGTVDILLSEERIQCFDPGFISLHGIQAVDLQVIIVKSAVHFRAGFDASMFEIIEVAGPGAEVMDVRAIAYSRLSEGVRFAGSPLRRMSLHASSA